VIDDTLLTDAKRLLGTKGIRDTVEGALRDVIHRHSLEQLRSSLGTMGLGLTSEELTELRSEE
jgi:Arc/MetJ family transcription regulator